jgi:hypothetical protein
MAMTETTHFTIVPETPSKRLANLFRKMVRDNDRRDALERLTTPAELLLGLTRPAYRGSASHVGIGK